MAAQQKIDDQVAEVLAGDGTALRLRWHRMQDAGASRLAAQLRAAPTHCVQDLDLTGCDIDDAGVGALITPARSEKPCAEPQPPLFFFFR